MRTTPSGFEHRALPGGRRASSTAIGSLLVIAILAAFGLAQLPTASADVIPGNETQGNNNTYVLLDSTDSNGPTYNSTYSPSNDSGQQSDNGNTLLSIGFPFTFYGTDYAEVYVGANGYLTFVSASTANSNSDLATNLSLSRRAIMPWFDDLDMFGGAGTIFYETFGAPGQRVFVVEFTAFHHDLGVGDPIQFQVHLFEANDRIEFHYADVSFGDAAYDSGASATVGVRNGTAGTPYLQYSNNTADIDAGMAIRFWQPTCQGTPVTLVGTRGDDGFFLTSANDVVYSHHGADTVFAGGGDDLICAGEGADTIYGGDGSDTVYGSLGGDTIDGEAGDDWLYGGGGNDTMTGGPGIDRMYGQAQNDELSGNGGSDFLYGGTGLDTLFGSTGDDLVNGGAGIDILNGGADNDLIVGGGGDDTINGGAGDDDLRGGGGDDLIEGYDGDDQMTGGGGNDDMLGYGGEDTMIGGPGIDTMNGGADRDILYGNGGDDIMNGATGHDDIFGSGGNDIMNGSSGSDTMSGGPGMDTVSGGGDDDYLFGNGDDDTLSGGAGYNELDGGGGVDACNIGTNGISLRCE